jgi:diadenosine tetraphosphate (Ap4A) HIT family hydrolase
MLPNCLLCCSNNNEQVIFTNDLFRVIYVADKFYLGYIRLILNQHIVEMSDLDEHTAHRVFSAILVIERVMRNILNPDKINLASMGNIVPHLHWHIIARYKTDRHFPNPIWGEVTNSNFFVPDSWYLLKQQLIESIATNLY